MMAKRSSNNIWLTDLIAFAVFLFGVLMASSNSHSVTLAVENYTVADVTETCTDGSSSPSCPYMINAAGYPVEMPIGIPHPNNLVPDAIMPTLPHEGNMRLAFPYDPISRETPTWANEAYQYYIDSSNPTCDDAANIGRGDQTTPRCTLPNISGDTWSLPEKTQLFVVGDGATYGGAIDLEHITMEGSAAFPVWVIGVGATPPVFEFERFWFDEGTHVFFENVHFYSATDNFRMSWHRPTGPVEYFTFRKVRCSGSYGTVNTQSRRCFSIGGTSTYINQFVVFYDTDVYGLGRWQDDHTTSVDLHGWQMQKWSRYVWIVDSRSYHLQADSIQCGNSSWFDYDYASRPHYIYIGGNEFYENYENAYDQKGCYHSIISSNYIHDFHNSLRGANNTAVILEQDSEGDIGGFTWFINNDVRRAGTMLRSSATTSDAFVRILGNVISEISGEDAAGLEMNQRCYSGGSGGTTCPTGLVFAQNTVDCNLGGMAIRQSQSPVGSDQDVDITGNIFYDCLDGFFGSPHSWGNYSDVPLILEHSNNVHYRTSGGAINLLTDLYDIFNNNAVDQDPLFDDPENFQYTVGPLSPAVDRVTTQHPAYDLFNTYYRMDIRKDITGKTIPASGPIKAGAYQ